MKKLLLILLVGVSPLVAAQDLLENNPTGLRWMQVNSPNFRVLFPEGFDAQAQRMASTLERIRSAEAKSMGREPRRISVILQNQSSISNGFVSMFPRRSEFYTMPPQNYNFVGSNDWLNLLASHEYRHIVQYQHATRGFNKFLFYLFGSPTLAGMAHAAAPDWFWEGDAVATETSFTPAGRGRIPNFSLVFRTNLLEGRSFNYHKQYLRSYRHFIPDHYVLGYHMVSYLRRRTGDPDIWEKITQRSWNVPFIPFAFSSAIRNKTGLTVTRLYREMAADLKKEWQQDIASLELTAFETVVERHSRAYTDYLYPQPQPDGSVIAMKSGIGDIEQFVRITDGKEERIFTPGYVNDAGMLSTANGIIVWNEFGYDPRWLVRNYSLVKAFDTKHRAKAFVSDKKSKFGAAAISPDGKKIVTVRTTENYRHNVLIISYPSGSVEHTFENPENYFYSMPRWSDDGKSIALLKQTPEGKTVAIVDIASGRMRDVLPLSHEHVGHPLIAGNWLLFNSGVSGIDNIYAVDLTNGKRVRATTAKYGAYNPAISTDGKFMYYNEQTRNGMDIVRAPFAPEDWIKYTPTPAVNDLYSHLVEQEAEPDLFKDIPEGNYPVKKFSRWGNLVNPYSWGLLVENDLSSIYAGLSSQDILSTMRLSAGYSYDLAERTGVWNAGLSYQGLFPVFDLNFSQGKRSVDETFNKTVRTGDQSVTTSEDYTFSWKEQNVNAAVRIPLVLTRSRFSSGVEASYGVGITKITEFDNGLDGSRLLPAVIEDGEVRSSYLLIDYLNNGTMIYNTAGLTAYRLEKRSPRDIRSRWGQVLSVEYSDTPFGGDFSGGIVSATGYLYLPGLFKHHSILAWGAYQNTMLSNPLTLESNDYLFRNNVPLPRGVNDYISRFRHLATASINYAMPLWYPDIALGPILNIQRVRLNMFGDVAQGESNVFNGRNNRYVSVGGELMFDLNILRFRPKLDLGVRYAYGIEPSVSGFELVIGTFNF